MRWELKMKSIELKNGKKMLNEKTKYVEKKTHIWFSAIWNNKIMVPLKNI